MVRIDLTAEERGYVAQSMAADVGFLRILSSYLPYLAPLALFAGYGAFIRDVTAVGLAFACLLALNLWWIHVQNRSATVFRSVCIKITDAEMELREALPGKPAGAGPAA